VPVTDMLRFHKFTIGHAWVSDYGCSEKEDEFPALFRYSPLHNITSSSRVPYPAVLVTTADHDDRVVPLHSFKYVATLQHVQGSAASQVLPLVVRIDCESGHGHGKPMDKVLQEAAECYAFMAHYTHAKWSDNIPACLFEN